MDDETYSRIRAGLPTHDRFTVVEVLRLIAREGIDTEGDFRVTFRPTYVLWQNVSREAGETVDRLMRDESVHKGYGKQYLLHYTYEGALLDLPLATPSHLPKEYTTGDRWLPVVFWRDADAS